MNSNFPHIVDLHCDLLAYLAENRGHTPYDSQARCSIHQLQAGGVQTQVTAIYTETKPFSQEEGEKQLACFEELLVKHGSVFSQQPHSSHIQILLAIENASGFCGEEEDLQTGFNRLKEWQHRFPTLAYVSLTWNFENRFGGGALTPVGLKADGKELLALLNELKIPIDLSHTSDRLAHDILNELEKKGWKVPILASHSNFRAKTHFARNMPDELARAIIQKRGIIGIAPVTTFVGEKGPSYLAKHVEHAFFLGGEEALCFGADFFYDGSVPTDFRKPHKPWFFPEYDNASSYPKMLDLFRQDLALSPEQLEKIAYRNASAFLKLGYYDANDRFKNGFSHS